ncbi:MAG: sulfite exporter TauE/SafE family protein [Desulfuromonas sp.]|nr:sulfite exporter TauE/SafE family protein [Desulfuromonas sp.]
MEIWSLEMLLGFALMGTCAGFLSGLLGIGGGVVLVPLFLWGFTLAGVDPQVIVHCAFATSLAVIIPTSISNTLGHRARGNFSGFHVIYLAIGSFFGALMGAWGASLLSGPSLKLAFGFMQLAVATKLLLGAMHPSDKPLREQPLILLLIGGFSGVFSAFFGVGGGVVAVPLMVLALHFPIHLAVGNSSALIVMSSLTGTCAYIFNGWQNALLPDSALGFVWLPVVALVLPFSLLGSRLGVKLAGRFSHAKLIKMFALLLIVVGLRIIATVFF